jgi:hypothetical protein
MWHHRGRAAKPRWELIFSLINFSGPFINSLEALYNCSESAPNEILGRFAAINQRLMKDQAKSDLDKKKYFGWFCRPASGGELSSLFPVFPAPILLFVFGH